MTTNLPALAASLLLTGCGAAAAVPAVATRSDSAGVEIVTSPDPATAPVWRLDPEPLHSIGGAEASEGSAFVAVSGALRRPDGSIVVSDARAGEVRLFDSTGRFVRVIARKGAGPGEVQFPSAPARFGQDSVAIVDYGQSRGVVFGPDLGAPVTVPLARGQLNDSTFVSAGALISLTEVFGEAGRMTQPKTLGVRSRRTVTLIRFGSDLTRIDTVAITPGEESFSVPFREGNYTGISSEAVGLTPSAEFALERRTLFLGSGDVPAVGRYDLDRGLVQSIRWPVGADAVTDEDRRNAFKADSTTYAGFRATDDGMVAMMLDNLRKRPFVDRAPVFTALIATDTGGVWVERDPRRWLPTRDYLMFDETGALVGRVDVPRAVRPYQVGKDWVLARWRDEDDVDHIRLYRLIDPRP